MSNYNYKRIADPVHGTIGLSELEVEIISSRVFQRLRNVNQLGLAHFVYPGANYSRFSHSVGTCHVAGQIFDSLRKNGEKIEDDEIRLYRLAALLHDIGHYPYSHPTEKAIKDYCKKPLYKPKVDSEKPSDPREESETTSPFFDHERVAKEILEYDSEIVDILKKHGLDWKSIYEIIKREGPIPYASLLGSDMDADRMDYMLRTSHHTGLPYGSLDIKYLISQFCLTKDKQLCINPRALKTADHFLLCRYFEYQQVYYHKSVTGFELVLRDLIRALLKDKKIDCSTRSITGKIQNGKWRDFDDSYILHEIRGLEAHDDRHTAIKAESILFRTPPKLVFEMGKIKKREDGSELKFVVRQLKNKIREWAENSGIDKELWYLWDSAMELTKIGSHIPVSALAEKSSEDEEGLQQAVQIHDGSDGDAISILEQNNSLMNILSDYVLYTIRIYVLLGHLPKNEQARRQREISAQIIKDCPELTQTQR